MGDTKETAFLRIRRGKAYLVHRFYSNGLRREKWVSLDEADRETLNRALQIKEDLNVQTVDFPCMNPRCNNTIKMTKHQLEDFFISSRKKYNLMILPFCSRECRDTMLEKHREAHK